MKRKETSKQYRSKSEDDFKTFSEKIRWARENYFNGSNRKGGLHLYAAARKIGISSAYLS